MKPDALNLAPMWQFRWLLPALLLCLQPGALAAAEPMQPMVVVALAGQGAVQAGMAELGKASDLPTFPEAVRRFLQRKTNITELAGIDPARPWGVVMQTDGLLVVPLVFVPVSDPEKVLTSLAPWWGEARQLPDAKEGTIYEVGGGVWTGYVKFQQGWMFVGQRSDSLNQLPRPEELTKDLCPRFDMAVQLHFRHVPEVFGTMTIDHVRLSLGDRLARDEAEPEATRALRRWWAELEYGLVERVLTESRSLTVGLKVRDQQGLVDVELDPLPDTGLARWIESFRKNPSRFAALHQGTAAATLHLSMALSAEEKKVAADELKTLERLLLDWFRETEVIQNESEEQLLHAWGDVLQAAIAIGRIDLGLALLGERLPHTMLLAAHVGDAPLLEKLVQRLTQLAPDALQQTKIETPEGTPTLWQFEFAEPGELPALEALFESPQRLFLAVGGKDAWLGVGPQAESILREHASEEEVKVSPLDLVLKLGTLASTGSEILRRAVPEYFEQSQLLMSASATLQRGDQTLTITQESADGKLRLRTKAGSGVLRAITMSIAVQLLFQ